MRFSSVILSLPSFTINVSPMFHPNLQRYVLKLQYCNFCKLCNCCNFCWNKV